MRSVFLPLVAIVALVACSSTLEVDDYDRSCSADTDCVAVLVGDICDCACESGAIAKSDEARYRSDRADISCSNQCGACAAPGPVVCNAGRCAMK